MVNKDEYIKSPLKFSKKYAKVAKLQMFWNKYQKQKRATDQPAL